MGVGVSVSCLQASTLSTKATELIPEESKDATELVPVEEAARAVGVTPVTAERLSDECLELQVSENDTALELEQRAASTMSITIQRLNGERLELEVSENDPILELKQTISNVQGYALFHQRLMLGTAELADDVELKSYGIGPSSVLSLMIDFGRCSEFVKRQNPVVGKVLAAMKVDGFKPATPQFNMTWTASSVAEVSDDEFDHLVEGVCGANESPIRAVMCVAFLGYRRATGNSGAPISSFGGLRTFNPTQWANIRTSLEPVTVHEDDVLLLLHLQTQLSAGICPIVMKTRLGKDNACLLANAGDCFLKMICINGCLDMDRLRCCVQETLSESGDKEGILIVATELNTVTYDLSVYSKLCRLKEEVLPRRLGLILCGCG